MLQTRRLANAINARLVRQRTDFCHCGNLRWTALDGIWPDQVRSSMASLPPDGACRVAWASVGEVTIRMVEERVPPDAREFIVRHIDSVAQMEALLLLWRERHGNWDAAAIARRLYITEQQASEALAPLCESGLVQHDAGLYRYDGASEEDRNTMDRLASIYSKHLIPVTEIIHAKPAKIRQFANAFKFKKDR